MSISLCALIIVQITNFPGMLSFSMIFDKILKFYDFSITGNPVAIFPGFQGFPGPVGTLHSCPCRQQLLLLLLCDLSVLFQGIQNLLTLFVILCKTPNIRIMT